MDASASAHSDRLPLHETVADQLKAIAKTQEWHAQRLVRVEESDRNIMQDISEIKVILARLDAIANMGRGALWITLRFGGLVAVVAGVVETLHIWMSH